MVCFSGQVPTRITISRKEPLWGRAHHEAAQNTFAHYFDVASLADSSEKVHVPDSIDLTVAGVEGMSVDFENVTQDRSIEISVTAELGLSDPEGKLVVVRQPTRIDPSSTFCLGPASTVKACSCCCVRSPWFKVLVRLSHDRRR